MGGDPNSSTGVNIIDFITIATTGNAKDFGDLQSQRRNGCSVSSPIRAISWGGKTGTDELTVMDYLNFATTGNGTDFGDNTVTAVGRGALSNAHGGLG